MIYPECGEGERCLREYVYLVMVGLSIKTYRRSKSPQSLPGVTIEFDGSPVINFDFFHTPKTSDDMSEARRRGVCITISPETEDGEGLVPEIPSRVSNPDLVWVIDV